MMSYYCQRCGHWLFDSDAAWGQVRHRCPARTCHTLQTVFLGGRRRREPVAIPPQPQRQSVPADRVT
jgi:hypothetical protein